MSTEADFRMAARRKNQKENFVGMDVKKARRVSELRSRQKQKRRSVWDQGREGLADMEEEVRAETPEETKPGDRKQMLLQWKRKRDEQTARIKSRQPKPFKVGSRNVGAPVPLPSVALVAKPVPKPAAKPVTKPVPHQFSRRSTRSSTRAQQVESKENVKPGTKAGRAGKARKSTASQPLEPTVPANFNFNGMAASQTSLGALPTTKFSALFPGGEFSPFKFNFQKNLDATGLVTIRGQKPATPPSGMRMADSPALWPNTPTGAGAKSPSSYSKKKLQAHEVQPYRMSPCASISARGSPRSARASPNRSTRNSPVAAPQSARASPNRSARGSPVAAPRSARATPNTSARSNPLAVPRSARATHRKSAASRVASTSPCSAKLAGMSLSSPCRGSRYASPVSRRNSPAIVTRGEASSAKSTSADCPVSLPFRRTMDGTAVELNALADTWEATVAELRQELPEEVVGRIDTAVGQARLLIRERFKQFSKLCDGADNPSGDKATHASDLQGFWEMISFQIDDVKQKFAALEVVKENGWLVASKTPKKKPKAKRLAKKKTPAKAAAAARERMRKFRMAKKLESELGGTDASGAAVEARAMTPSRRAPSTKGTPVRSAVKSKTPRGLAASNKGTPVRSAVKSKTPRGSAASNKATPVRSAAKSKTPRGLALSNRATPARSAVKSKTPRGLAVSNKGTPARSAAKGKTPRGSAVRSVASRSPATFSDASPLLFTKKKTPRGSAAKSRTPRSAKKSTPVAQPATDVGFDFSQYIVPMSPTKEVMAWEPSWLAAVSPTYGNGDLMSFSPMPEKRLSAKKATPLSAKRHSAKKIKPIGQTGSPPGAFVRSLAPRTPSNARRSKASSIGNLNSHVVVTPVRRSVRLMQTPLADKNGGPQSLSDLVEYSVWPNMALA